MTKDEKAFMQAAEKSARLPSEANKKAAWQAWKKLPDNSPYKSMVFEGKNFKSKKGFFG